jgi:hypothetical protein
MPEVGFEPTILLFERAKTYLALHGAATVIGPQCDQNTQFFQMLKQVVHRVTIKLCFLGGRNMFQICVSGQSYETEFLWYGALLGFHRMLSVVSC